MIWAARRRTHGKPVKEKRKPPEKNPQNE